jgi:chromosome partitioning protein
MYLALGKAEKSLAPVKDRFAKFIEKCRAEYDYVLIDCHPAGSIFTETSLKSSDHVLIPVAPSKYAIRGVGLMMSFLDAKTLGSAPTAHILFNDVPRIGTDPVEDTVRNSRFGARCLTTTLKHYKAFTDAQEGTGFVWASRKAWSTSAFQNLVAVTREFLRRLG